MGRYYASPDKPVPRDSHMGRVHRPGSVVYAQEEYGDALESWCLTHQTGIFTLITSCHLNDHGAFKGNCLLKDITPDFLLKCWKSPSLVMVFQVNRMSDKRNMPSSNPDRYTRSHCSLD